MHWSPDLSPNSSTSGFICSNRPLHEPSETLGLLIPQGVKRWTAIGTFVDPYWNRVRQGTRWEDIPVHTQFLLWEQHSGGYGILLPLLSGEFVNTLQGEKDGVRLVATSGHQHCPEKHPVIAYAATGENIYALINDSLQAVANQTRTFRLRAQKKVPAFVDHLGWCSWDAFYYKIDEPKFLSALRSFKKGGVRPGFVILDDGWLENRGDLLSGFGMNREKFPNGLESLVQKAKEQYGVTYFGIWHTLTGYWGGIDPGSRLAEEYDVLKNSGSIRPWITPVEKSLLYLITPGHVERFYADFHRCLKTSGVDLIKVDGQSALAEFSRHHFGRVSTMRAYQQALQGSAVRNFEGSVIHCMSNGLDVAYQMEQTLVWRNSDDFFPKRASSAQQTHLHTNALNNLWTGTFALPDWDMFQSHHRWADFHAAARALSGGPIYICDKPGRQNFDILRRLASDEGRVWRCDRPALPAPESIFADCRQEPVLLKIHNFSAGIGLIGLFHCSEIRKHLKGYFSPSDLPELTGKSFIARRYVSGEILEMNAESREEIMLSRMKFEIVTVSPLLGKWFAPLGRLGRYTGITSLETAQEMPSGSYRIHLKESGTYLFWCRQPATVLPDAQIDVSFNCHSKTRLLSVKVAQAGTITISRVEGGES